ncbi:MAG TPA: hypothetical protein VNZ22_13465 [Bacillota bacterium]|nr:hypothetical protein [Bacillota bacterium]
MKPASLLFLLFGLALPCASAEPELIRDPHFQSGFYLLEPKPGQRVVYGKLPGLTPAKPVWDLAQWSSRFPLQPTNRFSSSQSQVYSNTAKTILVGPPGTSASDLSLAVNAGTEYPQARKSAAEPWVHLLVQQNFAHPPALGELTACNFHVEARLKRSNLVHTNDYSPSRHAAQYFVYFTVANRNPKTPGFGECFWFGIPIYDNRHPVVPAYEAQDFGDTKLFIFTPGSDTFAPKSTHGGDWVTFEKDLLPLMRQGLEHARAKGFIKGSHDLADFRPLGVFIGWEVPGTFDVDLQIRNLSLKAIPREQ